MYIKNSPKSSLGRLFLNSRLLTDYNPAFNEISSDYCTGRNIQLWLYVQPLAFNVVVFPGNSLNQLRFFKGYDSKLSPKELIKLIKKHPLLYTLDSKGQKVPTKPILNEGLTIHLNLSGQRSQGVVALRARPNPTPIDLTKKHVYDIEDYFEPIIKKDKISITRGEYYLLSTKEVLSVPKHISIELHDYSNIGFLGPLHFAGFIDNGFEGDLVFEIRSDELSKKLELHHNMPISKLDVYRTRVPDKVYNQKDNNYKYQIGPKPAKYFVPTDYKHLAKKYKPLEQEVLVVDKNIINEKLNDSEFVKLTQKLEANLHKEFKSGVFLTRNNCESDDLVVQVVAYLIIQNSQGQFFTYKKKCQMDQYCEKRLFSKYSIGLGAHITKKDFSKETFQKTFAQALNRALKSKHIKLKNIDIENSLPTAKGIVFSDKKSVDKFHLGIVFAIQEEELKIGDKSIAQEWGFKDAEEILELEDKEELDSWSRIVIDNAEGLAG
jgi:predicted NUDIX family phosphoesterase/deoxycytidine triphosphate deaminase